MTNETMGPLALLGAAIRATRLAQSLQGKKTYINSVLMVAIGAYMLLFGDAPGGTWEAPVANDPATPLMLVLNGLGLGTLRAGVAKVKG